jgi:hypothetical protein
MLTYYSHITIQVAQIPHQALSNAERHLESQKYHEVHSNCKYCIDFLNAMFSYHLSKNKVRHFPHSLSTLFVSSHLVPNSTQPC